MNNEKINTDEKVMEKAAAPEKEPAVKKVLKPGTRMVSLGFILIAGIFLPESVGLHQKDPTLSGYSTFPLIVSGLLLILGIKDLIQNLKMKSESAGKGIAGKVKSMMSYLFPRKAVIFLLISIGYYIMLVMGVGFIISSLVFLLVSMCYLIPKSFKKNLLYSVVCVAALYVIFKVIFKVFLP